MEAAQMIVNGSTKIGGIVFVPRKGEKSREPNRHRRNRQILETNH